MVATVTVACFCGDAGVVAVVGMVAMYRGVDGIKWWKDLPIPGKLGEYAQIPGHIPTSQQAR